MFRLLTTATVLIATPSCLGFAPMNGHTLVIPVPRNAPLAAAPLDALDPATINSFVVSDAANAVLSDVAVGMTSTSVFLSETEPWVQPLSLVLGPFLNFFSFAMLCRIVLSWYPSANINKVPFNIVVWPTEPLLRLVRGSVPPAFGVDITPVVWLGIFSFMNEILLGQQGLLTMKMKYGI
mmetsp:Transcript_16805/g.35270  ORF Transcript_16805/g.35270 Transcript_16805/m.35270 type:complete len:180 (+) Transcript_16805:82-621(+)|eukprot:CAMPEP_0171341418 /NCGR_PEP_ID=MMETSP0878-20121228/10176_1 /TAXON_ID=67004 /ORGANISM="Thalassiosira weissflogii, Strain CCMP1336" /LENGTH=179 /DNA_ID=CAMNT_0011843649 /DNA_START=75 /DNA_END=614 /DNA_ORIENTATION=+